MKSQLESKTLVSLVLLAALAIAAVSQNANVARAQSDVATVIVMPTAGGTTDPVPGEYTYNNGSNIVLRAVPDSGYVFSYWIVSGDLLPGHTSSQSQAAQIIDPDTGEVTGYFPSLGSVSTIDSVVFSDNPTNITCGYGYTYVYTAYFAPIGGPSPAPSSTDAVVIVMPTMGGTVTPVAGMYTYANGTKIGISATPDPGYEFKYWVVTGNYTPGHEALQYSIVTDENGNVIGQIPKAQFTGIDALTFTTNPAQITCGYGYTYTYTAIFGKVATTTSPTPTPTLIATAQPTATPSPAATASPTPSPTPTSGTDMTTLIVVAVAIVIIIVVVLAAVMLRRKK